MKTHYLIPSLVLLILTGLFYRESSEAEAQSTPQIQNISGWAWSSNVGWIAFGSWPNRVRLETSSGNILGYAWNNNIGWIRFDPTAGVSGTYPSNPQHGARVNPTSLIVEGWARACAVFASGCSGTNYKSDIQLGGWDGWVKMSKDSGDTTSADYGVTAGGTNFSGQAWGGEVVGWIDFCVVSSESCVMLDELIVSCVGTPSLVDINTDISWDVTVIGNTLPIGAYTSHISSGTYVNPSGSIGTNEPIITKSSPVVGKLNFDVEVQESGAGKYGRASCSVDVVNLISGTKKLSVNINGEGRVDSDVGNPTVIACDSNINANTGACDEDYGNVPVVLTATAGVNSTFNGWTGDVPSSCIASTPPSTCTVTMDKNRSVTATFWPSVPPVTIDGTTLSLDKTIIRIDSHNSGLSVRSPSVKIKNDTDELLTFCVKDVTSKISSTKLNGVIITVPAQMARCYFDNDDESDKTCDYTDAGGNVSISSVTLAPKGTTFGGSISDSADFSIKLPVKLAEVKDKSPYKVVIGVCGGDTGADKEIEFQYQPLTFEPQ